MELARKYDSGLTGAAATIASCAPDAPGTSQALRPNRSRHCGHRARPPVARRHSWPLSDMRRRNRSDRVVEFSSDPDSIRPSASIASSWKPGPGLYAGCHNHSGANSATSSRCWPAASTCRATNRPGSPAGSRDDSSTDLPACRPSSWPAASWNWRDPACAMPSVIHRDDRHPGKHARGFGARPQVWMRADPRRARLWPRFEVRLRRSGCAVQQTRLPGVASRSTCCCCSWLGLTLRVPCIQPDECDEHDHAAGRCRQRDATSQSIENCGTWAVRCHGGTPI